MLVEYDNASDVTAKRSGGVARHGAQDEVTEADGKTGTATTSVRAALGQILAYVCRYPRAALAVFLLIVLDVAFNTVLSLSPQFVIDFAIIPNNRRVLVIIIVGLAVGFVAVAASQIWRDYLYAWLGARVLNDLRTDILEHLQILSLDFFARKKLGDLLARFFDRSGRGGKRHRVRFAWVPLCVPARCGQPCRPFRTGMAPRHHCPDRIAVVPDRPAHLRSTGGQGRLQFRTEQAALASTIEEQISAQRVIKAFDLKDVVGAGLSHQAARVVALASRFNFLHLRGRAQPQYRHARVRHRDHCWRRPDGVRGEHDRRRAGLIQPAVRHGEHLCRNR